MAQPVYATPADVAAFDPDAPAVTGALLRRASGVIGALTVTATYAVDTDGYPTDEALADALRDATCAQALWFDTTGDTTGADSRYQSMSLGTASLTRTGAGTSTGTESIAQGRYAPEAVQILTTAGLLAGAARSW